MGRPVKPFARWLRRLADRIDRPGAPKATHLSFTFEHRRGMVVREDGRGCRLWYCGDADYERAHADADSEHCRVDWRALATRGKGQTTWPA